MALVLQSVGKSSRKRVKDASSTFSPPETDSGDLGWARICPVTLGDSDGGHRRPRFKKHSKLELEFSSIELCFLFCLRFNFWNYVSESVNH